MILVKHKLPTARQLASINLSDFIHPISSKKLYLLVSSIYMKAVPTLKLLASRDIHRWTNITSFYSFWWNLPCLFGPWPSVLGLFIVFMILYDKCIRSFYCWRYLCSLVLLYRYQQIWVQRIEFMPMLEVLRLRIM